MDMVEFGFNHTAGLRRSELPSEDRIGINPNEVIEGLGPHDIEFHFECSFISEQVAYPDRKQVISSRFFIVWYVTAIDPMEMRIERIDITKVILVFIIAPRNET